jgi:TolB-like protein/DNA-binding winged helix-turn-helix (wHTH) protein/Tfp pilus assembly protein PilF
MHFRHPPGHVVRFGVFELDTPSGELRRHGLKVRLPDQAFQILQMLLSRPGEVVTRDELQQRLWTADTFVDFDGGLNSAIRKLREALDDSAENPRFIETVPRHGYRFVASVAVPDADPVTPPAAPMPTSSRSRRALATLAIGLLLVATIASFAAVYGREGLARRRWGSAAGPIRSLVVLPFENLTGDAGQEYFVDAVTDALTTDLARVAGLDVISRTSARQYKRPLERLPAIGGELNVDAVVEGAVLRSGPRVRITAQLIRTATDRHVWAQSYEGELDSILTLQRRIVSDIAAAAGHQPAASSVRAGRQTIDPQAYDAYLKGVTAFGVSRYESLRTAVAYFEDAIGRQPDFAEAHAQLARAQLQFLFTGPLSPREAMPKAEAAARTALELDDTLAQAHQTLGQILTLYHWKWDEGDQEYRRAAELRAPSEDPSMGTSLIRQGRFAEAVAGAERARKLDPLSFPAQMNVASAYRAAGQHDRAVAEFRRALEMSPGNKRTYFQLGATYVAMGRLEDAIRELEATRSPPPGRNWRFEAYLGYAYAVAGRALDARRILQALEAHRRRHYASSFGIALIHDALGEKAQALAALERAYQDRAVEFAQMTQYPPFRTIAAEPRYAAVMRDVGLPR